MTINFYNYGGEDKRVNKNLPAPTAKIGDPKIPVDILAPTFRVAFAGASAPSYNYAYVADLGRYYFVTGYTCTANGVYEVAMRCDVLKSYAGAIAGLSGFVMRNENSYDSGIIDGLAVNGAGGGVVKAGGGYSTGAWLPMDASVDSSKHWIVCCTPKTLNGNEAGTAVNIACTNSDALKMLSAMITADLNPLSANSPLISLSYCPMLLNYGTAVNSIAWGAAGTTVNLTESNLINYTDTVRTATWDFTLSAKHFSGVNSWANSASSYKLILRPFGATDLPPELCTSYDNIRVIVRCNVLTGAAVLSVQWGGEGGGPIMDVTSGGVNYTIQFGTSSIHGEGTDPAAFVSNVVSQSVPAIITDVSGIITKQLTAMPGSVSVSGSAICDLNPIISQQYPDLKPINASVYGRPLYQYAALSGLSGFTTVKCHVEISGATDEEKSEIERLLETGVIL